MVFVYIETRKKEINENSSNKNYSHENPDHFYQHHDGI